MSKSLNRVDLSGYVAYLFIGTSSQGNEYARFKLKHITGMRDGKETFTLIDCVVFGEALQHCRPFLVENTHCPGRAQGDLQFHRKGHRLQRRAACPAQVRWQEKHRTGIRPPVLL